MIIYNIWYIIYKQNSDRTALPLKRPINVSDSDDRLPEIFQIYSLIYQGAQDFLFAEYRAVSIFVVAFSIFILIVLGVSDSWINSVFTVIAFVVGCATSILAGYVGMAIGTFANARTAFSIFNFQIFLIILIINYCEALQIILSLKI